MLSHGSAYPVELPHPGATGADRLGFTTGVAVGVCLLAIAIQAWLGVYLAPLQGSWAAFTPDSIAATSRLAASTAWRCGVPAATAVALAAMLMAQVRRARWYAALAALALAALVATWYWAHAPWHAVADAIR